VSAEGLTPAGIGADVDLTDRRILRGRYDGEFDRTNLPVRLDIFRETEGAPAVGPGQLNADNVHYVK